MISSAVVKSLITLVDSEGSNPVAYIVVQIFFVKWKPTRAKLENQKLDMASITTEMPLGFLYDSRLNL